MAGCGAFHRSPTWATVAYSHLRPGGGGDPSEDYAQQLSGLLKSARIEHKVVSYEFRYRTRLREEAVGTRTAVIYRDNSHPSHPWWLMDDRLRTPFWLPGDDVNYQLSFYLRRPATAVSVNGQNLDGDGKGTLSTASEAPSFFARLNPLRRTERSRPFVAQPSRPTAPAGEYSEHWLARFRATNGTHFDPVSVADHMKMEQLMGRHRHTVALR